MPAAVRTPGTDPATSQKTRREQEHNYTHFLQHVSYHPKHTCSLQIGNLYTIYSYKTLDLHNILGHDCYCPVNARQLKTRETVMNWKGNRVWQQPQVRK